MSPVVHNHVEEDDDSIPHGTMSGYNNHGCRGPQCRTAWAVYSRERKERRRARLLDNPQGVRHGVYTTYSNHGCRCPSCTDAWVTYYRELRRSRRERHG